MLGKRLAFPTAKRTINKCVGVLTGNVMTFSVILISVWGHKAAAKCTFSTLQVQVYQGWSDVLPDTLSCCKYTLLISEWI